MENLNRKELENYCKFLNKTINELDRTVAIFKIGFLTELVLTIIIILAYNVVN